MKKLLILLFSAMISFNTYGEWTETSKTVDGDIAYVNFESIKKHNEYIYYWELFDMLKPWDSGVFSATIFNEVDCRNPYKSRVITTNYYSLPMGEGPPNTDNTTYEWDYPPPTSSLYKVLKRVCDYFD
jgi:hypothetical protein